MMCVCARVPFNVILNGTSHCIDKQNRRDNSPEWHRLACNRKKNICYPLTTARRVCVCVHNKYAAGRPCFSVDLCQYMHSKQVPTGQTACPKTPTMSNTHTHRIAEKYDNRYADISSIRTARCVEYTIAFHPPHPPHVDAYYTHSQRDKSNNERDNNNMNTSTA